MTALREEIIDYIRLIPEEKLPAIQPLLFMLSSEPMIIEKLSDEDLTAEDIKAFEAAESEYQSGISFDFDGYLLERGVK